jgi:hypothetical protein
VIPGIFSLLILAILVFGGRYQNDKYGQPQDMLVLFVGYLLGSVFLGAIMGVLSPWTRRVPLAVGAGWLAAMPMTAGIVAAQGDNLGHWTTQATEMAMGFSLLARRYRRDCLAPCDRANRQSWYRVADREVTNAITPGEGVRHRASTAKKPNGPEFAPSAETRSTVSRTQTEARYADGSTTQ